MPKWTDEQLDAINKDNTSIIVSAGAGSGKTAVLTARVIRKLEQGVNINELLILTFTEAAAAEMKDRIRKAIKKNDSLSKQLSLIDGAYITTFDSFSLSLVRRYHYLLGINKDINIVDSNVISYKKDLIIDSIFDELYKLKDDNFLKLIGDFCTKDDKTIKKYILNISSKMDLLYNKKEYLDNYISKYYDSKFIEDRITDFNKLLISKINNIKSLLNDLSVLVDDDYHSKIFGVLKPLIDSDNYDDITLHLDIKLPILPRGSLDESKSIKESISNIIKELKSTCTFKSIEEFRNGVYETKSYVSSIIKIIKRLDSELDVFKKKNNTYEFTDISKMAINVLLDNEDVRLELKNSLNEIMVDEYQDTSDLQEKFISLIENNNVYMVGDIKQSIYRFRNANPYIFKSKYDNYSNNNGGYKIDLNKNFRSREETLADINIIFNSIMDDNIGGADYVKSHQMIFGNTLYTENTLDTQNNHLEIYNYEYNRDSLYTREEIECFTVAQDIKNKINSKYQVFDKETGTLRDATYNDFVILIDRATKFDLYKKIFEYLNIPLTKNTDTSITDSDDMLILRNILGLLVKYNESVFDVEYKYYLTSIARSFLFRMDDNDIFLMLDNNPVDNKIIDIIKDISTNYDSLSISSLIENIIDKFNYYEKIIEVGNVQASIIRLEYMYNLALNSEKLGYDIEGFYQFLSTIIEDGFDIRVSISENSPKSVKLMTIHKSKGLEYPICYYTGLSSDFNIKDIKDRFLYDSKFGVITPYFKEGICKTFYNTFFKENYMKEEISEKIRLFYVALTRCREHMIIVTPLEDKTMKDPGEKLRYRSFLDMLNSIYDELSPFISDINIDEIGITKDYDLIKKVNYKELLDKTSGTVTNISLNIDTQEVTSGKFSKTSDLLVTKETRNKMNFGTEVHNVFEMFDFKSKDLSIVPVKYRKYIEHFIDCGIDFSSCNIYKEYEFVYNDTDNKIVHGKIDLMLEYSDNILIIDYKLKNISDEEYIKQLNGYKSFIELKTNKPVKIYLYSIIDCELKELKGDFNE